MSAAVNGDLTLSKCENVSFCREYLRKEKLRIMDIIARHLFIGDGTHDRTYKRDTQKKESKLRWHCDTPRFPEHKQSQVRERGINCSVTYVECEWDNYNWTRAIKGEEVHARSPRSVLQKIKVEHNYGSIAWCCHKPHRSNFTTTTIVVSTSNCIKLHSIDSKMLN